MRPYFSDCRSSKEDTYMYQNQAYHLTQHGFARDQVFDVIEKGGEEVSFH